MEGKVSKEEAKESISKLIAYLKQNLKHTNLESERAKGYQFILQFFSDFSSGKKEIRVMASMLSKNLDGHCGTTSKSEMEGVAYVFDYDIQFIPIKREEIPTIKPKGSRQYFTKAIFRKK